MSPFFSSILPTLFICFLLVVTPSYSQDLINQTCENFTRDDPNINYNFCTTSLQAAPASHCATQQGLGMIAIRLVSYNVTDTRCYVKRLLRNEEWDDYSRACLMDCLELYSNAIPTVKQAMKYYSAKQYQDADVQISAVMTSATTCEDGFNEGEVVSPLTKRNRDTFQLSAVVLSVMDLIQKRSIV